jgi:hypothetical protein
VCARGRFRALRQRRDVLTPIILIFHIVVSLSLISATHP